MARFARVIAVDVAHHVTQRGNGRQFILNSDPDREVYLSLLRESLERHDGSLVGYCLMSNHVHLVSIPHRPDGLARVLKHTHGKYAGGWPTSQFGVPYISKRCGREASYDGRLCRRDSSGISNPAIFIS